MRCLLNTLFPLAIVLIVCPARAGEKTDPAVLDAYNALVQELRPIAESDPAAAIIRYEEALLDGPIRGFGRLHLHLGQLHQKAGHMAEAAHHYKVCVEDERIDRIDREFICENGFGQVTGTLTLPGLPDETRVVVVEPTTFAGVHQSGARLPRGPAVLVIEAPGRMPHRTEVTIEPQTVVRVPVGVETSDDAQPDFVPTGDEPGPASAGLPRWTAYLAGGLGVALVGSGLAIGAGNRGSLDDIRARQSAGTCGDDVCRGDLDAAQTRAQLADGMWISGAALAAGAVVLWALSGEPASASMESAP